jgi:D-alanyl-D-alanine carboxypeptidase/D-alanyl-D-alanine-endopeptidase (penicillin-binding protein 4)
MRVLYFLASLWMIFCISDLAYAKHKTHKKTSAHRSVKRLHNRHYLSVSAPGGIYGTSQLASALNYAISTSRSNADIGVYVKSMKNGDVLFTREANQPLSPASTLKIFTAEAALLFLGPNYRFPTQLLTDASSVRDGVLQGNLYVVLSGDPSLTYNDLDDLLQSLQAHQIRAISGNVYIDNSAYDQSFYGPGWVRKDRDYCYGAPISASIINHNCLSFQPTVSKSSGHTLRLPKRRYSFAVSSVVTDIPDYNRTLFKSLLSRLAIRVYGNVTFGSAPNQLSLVGSHASKPLSQLVTDMLKKSDNIIAGAVFKKIGQLYSRQPGSWSNGSWAVSQILAKRAGVNTSGMRILDGSGLSPNNLSTPTQLMQVLDFAFHHPATSNDFITALPIAGVDGTLKHRLTNIARKVRAKTGTMSGIVSLAGYTISAEKEPLAFVIMINGSTGMGWRYKGLEDKIVTSLTRYKR